MAVVAQTGSSRAALFELKSASLTAVAFVLKTPNLEALASALNAQFGGSPNLFCHDPVVIDLAQVPSNSDLRLQPLIELLTSFKMLPVAVRGGTVLQMQAALELGLGEAPVVVEPVAHPAAQPLDAPPAALAYVPTLVVQKPLRSGQQVYAKHGDLIIMGAVNFGAEVLADGNIHVYGPLRGKAIAGVKGNSEARIFTTCMEPELVSIAGTYRTTEAPLPPEVVGRPAQIFMQAGRLVFEPLFVL